MACGHCIVGVICRVLRLGSCEFSSVEEDELAIFLLPIPVSLPGGKVGVYASFRTISFSFKAVRSEYLSRTQRLRKGRPFCPQHDVRHIYTYNCRAASVSERSEANNRCLFELRRYIYIYRSRCHGNVRLNADSKSHRIIP